MKRILLGLLLVVLTAVGVVGYRFYSSLPAGLDLDREQAAQLARSILPGVVMIAPIQPLLSLKFSGGEAVVLAKSPSHLRLGDLAPGDIRVVLVRLEAASLREETVRSEIESLLERVRQGRAAHLTEVSKQMTKVNLGGRPHPAQETLSERKDPPARVLEYRIVDLSHPERPVLIMAVGPESQFPRDWLDEFLRLGQPAGGNAPGRSEGPGGLRRPAARPDSPDDPRPLAPVAPTDPFAPGQRQHPARPRLPRP